MAKSVNSVIKKNISLILEVLTMLLLLVAVIFFIIKQQSKIAAADAYCSVKSAFGLYIIALCSQIMLLTLDCVTIMIAAQTQGACTFESYHLKVNLHFASALAVFIGIIVESSGGIKGWQFYICLIAGFLAAFNAIMWFITQRRVRRSKVKAAIRNAEETIGGGSEAAGASAETLTAEAVDKAQETVDKVKGKAVEKAKEKAVKQAKKKAVKAALKKL